MILVAVDVLAFHFGSIDSHRSLDWSQAVHSCIYTAAEADKVGHRLPPRCLRRHETRGASDEVPDTECLDPIYCDNTHRATCN